MEEAQEDEAGESPRRPVKQAPIHVIKKLKR